MTLEEQIQKLTAERDAARADLKAIGECVGGEPLAVRGLVEYMDAAIKERDAALKACAEMRTQLKRVFDMCCNEDTNWDYLDADLVRHSLSSDCGKGYIKAESLRCFKCDDGHTPLYCLNCAQEINSGGWAMWHQIRDKVVDAYRAGMTYKDAIDKALRESLPPQPNQPPKTTLE